MADELPNVQITQAPLKKVNPLANYYRQPKLYIKLPSKGQYYPVGALDVAENGDYAVYAMTAKDELMLKTPDALLSGESTVQVIKSCIPAILDPWQMPTIDVDAALIAIRIATYGESMDVTASCPYCKEESKYSIPLTNMLNKAQAFEWEPVVDADPLVINIKPYNYQMLTKTSIKALEQQRILGIVTNDQMSEEEKLKKFNESFVKLTELTVDTLANVVSSIESPEGVVTDRKEILEFMNNAPKEIFDRVQKAVGDLKEKVEMAPQTSKCESCEKEFTMPVTLDQSNFFAGRS